MGFRLRRRSKQRLRPIGEAEAYHHSYGERSADVRTVKLPPRPRRFTLPVSGEALRRRFEERLAHREEEAEAEELEGDDEEVVV